MRWRLMPTEITQLPEMKSKIILIISLILCCLCGCGSRNSSLAAGITNVSTEDNSRFTCEYEGVLRDFTLYLPDNLSKNSVLVMALHGYGSDGDSFARDTKLHEKLCPGGYALAYITGIPDPDDKTAATGWNSGLKKTGNDDAGFLCSLAAYLQKEYSLNSKRCVAVGFSNGAFMTHKLALHESGIITDIVSVSGMMPQYAWEERPEKAMVNVLQISGSKDDVVPQKRSGSDKYAKAPAIEDVMDYYAMSSGLDIITQEQFTEKSDIIKYSSEKDEHIVWSVTVKDGRHSWFEEPFCGFEINDLIMEFLEK